MTVATVWVISVGGEVDANVPQSSIETLPLTHMARRLSRAASEAATDQLMCAWDPHHVCCAGDGRPIADGTLARIFMAWFAS